MSQSQTDRARALRKQPTWAEKRLWRWLRDRQFSSYKFRRNYPIGKYFLDFYCPEAALSIELDGGHHGYPVQQTHDAVRVKYIEGKGIKELRFWNSDLARNPQSILDTIFQELQSRGPHDLPEYTKPLK